MALLRKVVLYDDFASLLTIETVEDFLTYLQ